MDAREYLEKYAVLKQEARSNEERIEEAENEALIPAMKQGDGSQRTPGRGDRQEKANIRYIEVKERIQPLIDSSMEEMREIEDTINRISDGLAREVLRRRYIDTQDWEPVKWKIVAMKMYGNDEDKVVHRLHRIHREALDSISAVLMEKEKSHR